MDHVIKNYALQSNIGLIDLNCKVFLAIYLLVVFCAHTEHTQNIFKIVCIVPKTSNKKNELKKVHQKEKSVKNVRNRLSLDLPILYEYYSMH